MKTEKHLQNNMVLERQIDGILDNYGHINGQSRFPVRDMNFGNVNAGFASCELIAVFNVLKESGIHIPLSKLIYEAETLGYLLAGGLFGTKLNKIGNLLERYGIKYVKIKPKDFLKMENEKKFSNGDVFIITIKNNKFLPISPLHTFEMSFSENRWTVYNRFSSDNHCSIYSNLKDILNNGRVKGSYYMIYKVLIG